MNKEIKVDGKEQKISERNFVLDENDIRKTVGYPRCKKMLLDWMMLVLKAKKCQKYATYVLKLFKRFENTNKNLWTSENLQLIGTSVLYTTCLTFHNHTVSVDDLSKLTDFSSTKEEIANTSIKILQDLFFDTFPIVEYCEEIISYNTLVNNWNAWVNMSNDNCDMTEEEKFYKSKSLM